MIEKEKMIHGELYDPNDSELRCLRDEASRLCYEYNNAPSYDSVRSDLLSELIVDSGSDIELATPIRFDYGIFTTLGSNVHIDSYLTCLDAGTVKIGNNVTIGCNVSLLTDCYLEDYRVRRALSRMDREQRYALPITIGDDCLISSFVIINGGVSIGRGSVIASGSVVSEDIPENVYASGFPARVIREIKRDERRS